MKRTSWLCGAAAAVLIAASGMAASALAQDNGAALQGSQNSVPNRQYRDSSGTFTIDSNYLRKKDPFYQLVELHYKESRITEAQFNELVQQHVNDIGKLVSRLSNEISDMTPDKADRMFGALIQTGGKMMDVINSDNSTSADIAGAFTDMLPSALQASKDAKDMVLPAVQEYANSSAQLMGQYNDAVQSGNFSPSEKRRVRDDTARFQSYIRLNMPSNIGTNDRQLDQAIAASHDPAKQEKLKKKITQAIDRSGGPDVFRRSVKAQMTGDEGAIIETQTEMAAHQAFDAMDHLNPLDMPPGVEGEPEAQPTPAPSTPKKPVKKGVIPPSDPYAGLRVPQAQQQEPEPAPRPTPVVKPKPKPLPQPVQMVEIDRETGLPKPMVTHPEDQRQHTGPLDPVILHSTGDSGHTGDDLLAMGSDEYDSDYDPDLVAYDSPFTLEGNLGDPIPDGSPRPDAGGMDHSGHPFTLSDEQSAQNARDIAAADAASRHHSFTLEDLGPGTETDGAAGDPLAGYTGPEAPVYHEPDPNGGFTPDATNGWWEMPDGEVVAANADHSLPDGALAAHGTRRVASGDAEDADNDYDVDRMSDNQTRSARDGNFYDADAFDAAMAALSDSIDANNRRIEDESDAAMQRWDDYADQVYYDEQGNIHRVAHDRPVNDYQAEPRDTRSATQIDRDRNENNPWNSFDPSDIGEGLEVADLEAIYAGYDIDTMAQGEAMRSLSSAGTSLSSAGNSLGFDLELPGFGPTTAQLALDRANGMLIDAANEWHTPTDWPGLGIGDDSILVSNGGHSSDPALASLNSLRNQPGYDALYGALHGDNLWLGQQPLAETGHDLAEALYGPLWSDRPYRLQAGAGTQYGAFTAGLDVANLAGLTPSQLRALTANDVNGGLSRLLAQPFNVLLTWGAGAYDLDLHMTGPVAEGSADRFHIYFDAKGALDASPYAQLIKDCICNSGSEVILTSALVKGQVYRISVFDYGDQSASSTNLSLASNATIQIVRGGTAVSTGNGTTIEGGHVIYTGTPTTGDAGNTWVAVEIDPNTGKIRAPDTIIQSPGSDNVH